MRVLILNGSPWKQGNIEDTARTAEEGMSLLKKRFAAVILFHGNRL